MAKEIRTIGVMTSGGDSQGMNACVRAVVRSALNKGLKVKGISRGFSGLMNSEVFDMDAKSAGNIINKGGTILYTARCPEFIDKDPAVREAAYQKAADKCNEFGIDGLVVIGGDGTLTSARDFARKGVRVIGVPKTIDNDLMETDHCPGFGSAAKYVASAFLEIAHDTYIYKVCLRQYLRSNFTVKFLKTKIFCSRLFHSGLRKDI